jgi:plastocyanin
MSIYKITIKAGSPATNNPDPQTVHVNDSVYWFNGDPKEAHWPAPSAANPKGFMQFQVTPNASSSQVSFGTPKTINYICNNHKGETGTIIVLSAKAKGAYGKKTKKGAFGSATKKGALGNPTIKNK